MRFVLVILVILMGVVSVFAIQNPGIVTVSFFNYSGSTSILVVIVVSFGAGVIVGILPGIPTGFKRKRRIRELESDLATYRKSDPPSASTAP